MIMQTIHLYDKLDIAKTKEPGIAIKSNLSYVPTNESNLVYKAGKLLMDEFGITEGVSVDLNKRIPVAAGMAGGSTDAAAMLYGMNRIFELGLSQRELMERGVKIGADVPYCLMRGTALAEGIGEKLTQLPPMVKCPVLIAKPQISVSTKFVYENLKLNENTIHPDIDQLVTDIQNKDLPAIAGHMGNVLETVTIPEYPIIADIKNKMMESGAINSMMSGSGPTVFGLFADEETAKKAYKEMLSSGLAKQVYLTTIYNNRRE
jgi:4-diphosphocytidyl-2-C-methyl-D-erythritol kinase